MSRKEFISFEGKNVVVTGGAQGVGSHIARGFAEVGANVCITYLTNDKKADAMVAELSSMGVDAAAFKLDHSDPKQCEAVSKSIIQRFGHIDSLINNAGTYPWCNLMDITEKEWDAMMNTNTKGVFFFSQQIAKRMIEGCTHGTIVSISSISAVRPTGPIMHYGMAKAAIDMMIRCMAVEFGPHGIRVNGVAPGVVDAPGIDDNVPDWRARYSARAPLGRFAKPEEIADACIYLASDRSSFITGEIIQVSGGILQAEAF